MAVVGTLAVNVVARTTQFQKGMKDSLKATKQFNSGMGLLKQAMGIDVFRRFLNHASDVQETMNRTRAIFKGSADEMIAWSKQLGDELGRSSVELGSAASNFAQMAVGIGATTAEAKEFAKTITRAGVDFASFNNITEAEAFQRIRSMLAGSAEVMDQFGVNTRVANLGISKTASELEKFNARAKVFMEAMGRQGAMGDALRTADDYANVVKRIKADLKEAVAWAGKLVLPIAETSGRGLAGIPKLYDIIDEQSKMVGEDLQNFFRGRYLNPRDWGIDADNPDYMSMSQRLQIFSKNRRKGTGSDAILSGSSRSSMGQGLPDPGVGLANYARPAGPNGFGDLFNLGDPRYRRGGFGAAPGMGIGMGMNAIGFQQSALMRRRDELRAATQPIGLSGAIEAGSAADIRSRAGAGNKVQEKQLEELTKIERQLDQLNMVMKPDPIAGFSSSGNTVFGAPTR